MSQAFQMGKYRPIYLWAGPGTIRMNKLKFMDYPVDEEGHRAAHEPQIASLVADDLYSNWVHLTYNWGFPPEVEAEDWEDFAKAVKAYHAAGAYVFAYIQSSNCVYSGSFAEKDWYALDTKGRKVNYYSGRYMTDWTHPDWLGHLRDRVIGALERGADGIFFDNMWYGERPNGLLGAWLGGAGCYCERCHALYKAETGRDIPTKILPQQEPVADYLRWRSKQVTAAIGSLAEAARQFKPGTPISANDYVVTMHNTYLIYGVDVEALARIQDVIMVENFALPRWEKAPKPRLANNALTIRNTHAIIRDQAHLSVLSYDEGIGFDPVYPPRRHQLGIAEAAALGASMTIKGTEYNDGQRMVLLTDKAYRAQHEAIGSLNRWLDEQHSLYQARTNSAPVGLMHPGENLWRHWYQVTPVYYGAGQALTWQGIPWRVVRPGDSLEGLAVLLTFKPSEQHLDIQAEGVNHIHVPNLPGWAWPKLSPVARGGFWYDLVKDLGTFLLQSYHNSKFARQVMDLLQVPKLVFQTKLFTLPDEQRVNTLLAALPAEITPRVKAENPVLIDVWLKGEAQQIHLVNYGPEAQSVRVYLAGPARVRVISPDHSEEVILEGAQLAVDVDLYSILILE